MRYLIYILLLGVFTLAAIWLVPYLPGYVLVRIGGWALETSVVALGVLLILVYFVMSGSVWLWNLPGNSARSYADKRSRAQLELGMLALAEGNWDKAEKALKKSARHSTTPSVSYLAAAQAAHGPGAEERRARYLEEAERAGDAHASVLITRARLLLADKDPAGALEVLSALPDRQNRPRAMDLLARCYEQLGRWEELAAITPDLVRHGIIDAEQAERINERGVRYRLEEAASLDGLATIWQSLPRSRRRDPDVLASRAERALELGGGPEIEPEVRKALGREWSSDLCRVWGRIEGGDLPARLKAAEGWLDRHADDPVLHLALGRFYRAAGREDRAAKHLERATARGGVEGAWAELGLLREGRGEHEAALAAYRAELGRILPGLPAAPVAAPAAGADPGSPPSEAAAEGAQDPDPAPAPAGAAPSPGDAPGKPAGD